MQRWEWEEIHKAIEQSRATQECWTSGEKSDRFLLEEALGWDKHG